MSKAVRHTLLVHDVCSLNATKYVYFMQVWNFDFLNATQGQVYGNASATYETLTANRGNTVFLGILVQAAVNNIQPQNITVNGQQCRLQLLNNITGELFFGAVKICVVLYCINPCLDLRALLQKAFNSASRPEGAQHNGAT